MINRPENVFSYMFTMLLALQAVILLFWASYFPFASAYEGEIISGARQMIKTADWFFPEMGPEQPLYHTPILPYWLAAVGGSLLPWKLLGFRLIPLILYLLAFWGFFRAVRKYLDPRTAFYSSCMLACSLPFSWQMQLATPDGLYALLFCSSLFGFYLLLKTNQQKFFWLLYSSLALGLLVKGLVALLLPMLIMAVYLMFKIKMNEGTLKKLFPGKGILMIILISAPWFIYAGVTKDGVWLQNFLNKYHWERYLEGNPAAEGHFYLPFLFIILMTLPFGIYLPKSFSFSWKYRHKKDLLLLSALSFLIILLFFAFSGTFYPHYLLPAIPFAAVLLAYRFSYVAGRSFFKMGVTVETGLLIILSLLLPAFAWYYLGEEVAGSLSATISLGVMLAVLPLGTTTALLLWKYKRTDEGLSVLTLSFLVFFVLLLYFIQLNPGSAELIQYLIY